MKWRYVLVVFALVALFIIAFTNRQEILEAARIVITVKWQILLLIPLIQLISFYANARYYENFFQQFKYKIPLSRLLKMSFALNFVNQVAPSVGVSAASFAAYSLKDKVPAGKVTLVQYGRYSLTYISYAVILVFALCLIYFGGGIDKIAIRLVIILVVSTLAASAFFVFALSTNDRFNRLLYGLQRMLDRTAKFFRRDKKPLVGRKRIENLLNEFHNGYDLVMKERHRLRVPFFYALVGNVMEVSTLYVVFIALEQYINPGSLIISYAAANAASVISIIPGDFGVYEVTLVAALSAVGIPVAVGLTATLLYRIINKALFLPIGFYFYSEIVGRKRGEPGNFKR